MRFDVIVYICACVYVESRNKLFLAKWPVSGLFDTLSAWHKRSIRNASDENDKHITVSGTVTSRKRRRYCVCIVFRRNRNLKKKKEKTTKNPTLRCGETIKNKKTRLPEQYQDARRSRAYIIHFLSSPPPRLHVSIIRVRTRFIVVAAGEPIIGAQRCKIQIFTAPHTCRIRLSVALLSVSR